MFHARVAVCIHALVKCLSQRLIRKIALNNVDFFYKRVHKRVGRWIR